MARAKIAGKYRESLNIYMQIVLLNSDNLILHLVIRLNHKTPLSLHPQLIRMLELYSTKSPIPRATFNFVYLHSDSVFLFLGGLILILILISCF